MSQTVRLLVVTLFIACFNFSAVAHESQPGSLEIVQLSPRHYDVTWLAPIYYGRPHPARLELPETWVNVIQPTEKRIADATLYHWLVDVGESGIEGSIIVFSGLESTVTDVYVRTKRQDSTVMTAIARPTKPFVTLRGERPWHTAAREFVTLGFQHILLGIDHLLFVLGLLLIVQNRGMLIKTITSFTVAHSITLAVATLGYANIPLPPLNVAVALSIFFLGPEIVRTWRGERSFTITYPWVAAFPFGLLHGFGFASGLSSTGMPKTEVPLALLSFNIGVEIGQLVFVSIALAVAFSFRVLEMQWPRWALALPGYTVGSLGAYWTIQRAVILVGGLVK